jgi:membrane protein required for colicin V production
MLRRLVDEIARYSKSDRQFLRRKFFHTTQTSYFHHNNSPILPFAESAVPAILRPMLQSYDFLMLAVLVGSLLFGAWKGVAWQIAALASVFVSAMVAVHSSPALARCFGTSEPWNRFIAMLILYIATAAIIWLGFRLVARMIDRVQLKEFDRQLGALFGLAKGILYCVIITFFAVTLAEESRQMVLQSRSGDLIARGIRRANPILPEDVRNWLGKYIDELDQKLQKTPADLSQPPLQQPPESVPPTITPITTEPPSQKPAEKSRGEETKFNLLKKVIQGSKN